MEAEHPKDMTFHVKLEDGAKGPLLATSYVRLVVGGRGSYVEFLPEQINREELEVEPGQEYRLSDDWREKAFYAWYRTKAGHRKVYEQYRHVGYADYVPGRFYVSPADLVFAGKLHKEVSRNMPKPEDLPRINFDE